MARGFVGWLVKRRETKRDRGRKVMKGREKGKEERVCVCMYVCERERKKERETSGNPLVREHGIVSRVHEPCRG